MKEDLLQQVYKEMSAEITATIDNDLLCSIFESQGWSRVEIPCATDTKYVVVLDWVKNNINHNWRGRYDSWVFESVEDAILFELTWGE